MQLAGESTLIVCRETGVRISSFCQIKSIIMDLRNIFRKLSISEIDVIIAIAKSIRYEKTAATSDTIDTDTVTRRVKWVI